MDLVLALLGVAIAAALGFAAGRRAAATPARRDVTDASAAAESDRARAAAPDEMPHPSDGPLIAERARLVRSFEAEAARTRRDAAGAEGRAAHALVVAEDRHALFDALAAARAETARYREIVIAIEDNAPPPLLGGRGAPDDLKLIVGIGPVLERMLHQLGITSYRQIALWTPRDIDAIEAHLPEFPGRIERDAWVVQARALHQSVYGESPHR